MRGLCILLLAVTAGCATTNTQPSGNDQPRVWDGEGLDYATTRPAPDKLQAGAVVVDLTLVDLDEDVAAELLGTEQESDIAPRVFKSAMGEIAAVNACYGFGRLLSRPSVVVKPGEDIPFEWTRTFVYLMDWRVGNETISPLFSNLEEGVVGKLHVEARNGAWSVSSELTTGVVLRPFKLFQTALADGAPVAIEAPELAVMTRVAVETIRPGETAMFQLGRVSDDEGGRVRLLFVRIDAAAE